MPVTEISSTAANWAQIIAAGSTTLAAVFAWWSAWSSSKSTAISSIDTGFEIVHKLIDETKILWGKYDELKMVPKSKDEKKNDIRWQNIDKQLDKILDSAEWSCIYLKSRKKYYNYSIKQLEDEVLLPIERILEKSDSSSEYLKNKIDNEKSSELIYGALKELLNKRKRKRKR